MLFPHTGGKSVNSRGWSWRQHQCSRMGEKKGPGRHWNPNPLNHYLLSTGVVLTEISDAGYQICFTVKDLKKKNTIYYNISIIYNLLYKHYRTTAVLHKTISVEIINLFYLVSYQHSILMEENVLPEYVEIVHCFQN